MLSIPPPNFKNRKGYGQNATLIRGNAGSSTVHGGSNGSSAINKKAQGVGLLVVRDFVITPYQGEPPRTEQFKVPITLSIIEIWKDLIKLCMPTEPFRMADTPSRVCWNISHSLTAETVKYSRWDLLRDIFLLIFRKTISRTVCVRSHVWAVVLQPHFV